MAKAKKAKRAVRPVVMYIRVKPADHVQITKVAAKLGHPHTIASVASELISRALPALATEVL